jgi:hypothetical protein
MKAFTLAGALALTAAPAFAQDPAADPMAGSYGNTIVMSIPPYWSARQYIEPDHTWRQVDNNGRVVLGTWKLDKGQNCLTETKPPGPTRCYRPTQHKVGDLWTNQDADTGATVFLTIEKGRKD